MAVRNNEMWVRCDSLFTPFQRVGECLLHISDGRILEIVHGSGAPNSSMSPLIHEPGAMVAPGFIDLHVHGARGRDLMDGTLQSLQTVAETLARHGTTAFLATTL